MSRPVIITAVLAAALSGCSPTANSPSTTSVAARLAPVNQSEAVASINALRRANGLGPVRLDAAVTAAARAQSLAMARQGVLSHDAGGDFRGRLQASGVGRAPAVENIAWGHRTFAEAMATWRASSLHSSNMLAPDMTRLGVAAAPGAGGTYWTLVLAGDAR